MKSAKLPPVSEKTKILCFDLESNGLHGQAFAVGAVVMDSRGKVYDEFTGRTKVGGQIDPWVEQNVLPAIKDMPVTHATYKDLREDFWKWYLRAEPKADYVLVNNGYPVEYKFLLDCQNADLDNRYWQHPFPLIDLSSLLLGLGQLNDVSKKKLMSEAAKNEAFVAHHPLHDAKVTALTAIEALKSSK